MRQKQIKGLYLEELTSLCTEQGFTPFRAKQIYHWMYRHGVMDISLMNNIPENVKKFLEDNYTLKTLEIEMSKDKQIFLAGKRTNMLGLEQALGKLDVKNKKRTAVIRADKILPYGEVIEVMGLLQKAGILDISVAVK